MKIGLWLGTRGAWAGAPAPVARPRQGHILSALPKAQPPSINSVIFAMMVVDPQTDLKISINRWVGVEAKHISTFTSLSTISLPLFSLFFHHTRE